MINFCDYAPTVNGVLKDQITTYISGKEEENRLLAEAGEQITERLGMTSNVTISLPLKVSLEGAEFITIFLNTILGTIIAFLGILSV